MISDSVQLAREKEKQILVISISVVGQYEREIYLTTPQCTFHLPWGCFHFMHPGECFLRYCCDWCELFGKYIIPTRTIFTPVVLLPCPCALLEPHLPVFVISAFEITFVSLKCCDGDFLGLRFSLILPFCLMAFSCHDQQVATSSKELTKSGSLRAETVFVMHFTCSVTQRWVASEVFLLQKTITTKTMARILNAGSQNQACKLKI